MIPLLLILAVMVGSINGYAEERKVGMIYRVNYEYWIGPTGPYDNSVLLEAKDLKELQDEFESYKTKKHSETASDGKGKIIPLQPSGDIKSIVVEGYLQ